MKTPLTLETTPDETTVNPLTWAMILDDVREKLDLHPVRPSYLYGDINAYCRRWFHRSVGSPSKGLVAKFDQLIGNPNLNDEEKLTAVYAFLVRYHDTADWRKEQALIRFAQRHVMAEVESGSKAKRPDGSLAWNGTMIYEWPPLIQGPSHSVGLHHKPARYLFFCPKTGERIDLGMTDPNNPRFGPVMHTSPDKAMQAICSRLKRRIGGDFATVFSRLHRETMEITPFRNTNSTQWKGLIGEIEIALPVEEDEDGNETPITDLPDLIIPAPITCMIKGTWVIILTPQINPRYRLTSQPDPEKRGHRLTVTEATHAIIAEPSQPAEDDPTQWDPRSDDLVNFLDGHERFLENTDKKWEILEGNRPIESHEQEILFAIAEEGKATRRHMRRIASLIRTYNQEAQHNLLTDRERTTLKGLKADWKRLDKEFLEIENAMLVIRRETGNVACHHEKQREPFTLKGIQYGPGPDDWHNPCRSDSLVNPPAPEAYELPTLPEPQPLRFRTHHELPWGWFAEPKVVSTIKKDRPAITATGRRMTIPSKRPTFSLRHDGNDRLKHTLAMINLHGRLSLR